MFQCHLKTAETIFDVQRVGYEHGCLGNYRDGEFSEDEEWNHGTGALISVIENVLGINDRAIFKLYDEAHSEGLKEYFADHPEENEDYDPSPLYPWGNSPPLTGEFGDD